MVWLFLALIGLLVLLQEGSVNEGLLGIAIG
jgi:hypothetical protein